MPPILKIGRYVIYFWSDEGNPREPVHVHVAVRHAVANATKLWITSSGKVVVCNNNSRIPDTDLRGIIDIIEHRARTIVEVWYNYFGEIRYHD